MVHVLQNWFTRIINVALFLAFTGTCLCNFVTSVMLYFEKRQGPEDACKLSPPFFFMCTCDFYFFFVHESGRCRCDNVVMWMTVPAWPTVWAHGGRGPRLFHWPSYVTQRYPALAAEGGAAAQGCAVPPDVQRHVRSQALGGGRPAARRSRTRAELELEPQGGRWLFMTGAASCVSAPCEGGRLKVQITPPQRKAANDCIMIATCNIWNIYYIYSNIFPVRISHPELTRCNLSNEYWK